MVKVAKLHEMKKGWFVGDFEPSLLKTGDVEVAVKKYLAGDFEDLHHHRIATEFTVITEGEVEMNGKRYIAGDIVVIHPKEATDFKALTDTTTTVVKIPGSKDDKYLGYYDEL